MSSQMASARQRRELELLQEKGSLTGFISQAILKTYEEKLIVVNETEARMSHIILKGIWYLSCDHESIVESQRCLQHFSQMYLSLAAQETFRSFHQDHDHDHGHDQEHEHKNPLKSPARLLPVQIWQYIRSFFVIPTSSILAPEVLIIIPNRYPHAPYRIRFLTQTDHPAIALNSGSIAGDEHYFAPNELSTSLLQVLFTPLITIGEQMALFRPFFVPMNYWSSTLNKKSLSFPCDCPYLSLCTPCNSVAFHMISIGHELNVTKIPRFPYIPQCNLFVMHEIAVLHYAKVVMQLEGTRIDGNLVDVVHDSKYEIVATVIEDPTDSNGPKCAYNCDGNADILDILSSESRSCKDIWTICVVAKDEFDDLRSKVNAQRMLLNVHRQNDPLFLFTSSKDLCQWIVSNEYQTKSYEQIVVLSKSSF